MYEQIIPRLRIMYFILTLLLDMLRMHQALKVELFLLRFDAV